MTLQVLPVVAARGGARWRASGWDYLLIVAWLGVLTLLGAVGRAVLPLSPSGSQATPGGVLVTDVVALVGTVLPVWVYLTATEAGARGASWGKRRAGLRVVQQGGVQRLGWRRSGVRAAVKLLPWQLAHLAVTRIILGVDQPRTIAVTYGLSLLLAGVTIAMAWRDPQHRALHDRVAGTRVVRAGRVG